MADSDAPSTPATPPPPPPPQTLGQTLRAARLGQELTLEQLSTELRIEAKQLNALEEDRFEQIGVPVFVKGYLKQYCLRLGLNFHDMLALYYEQTTLPDVQIQPSRTIKLRDERQITTLILAAIILLAVVAGLAWWWNGGNFAATLGAPRATEPAETSDVAPPPAEPPFAAQPAANAVATPPPVAAGPATDAAGVAAAPAVATPETLAAAVAADGERAAPAVAIPLEFTFDQESWAEVTDGRGERLVFGLNAAGRRVTVRGEPPFAIVLGNANSVRLNVDGEPYSIPTTGRQGALARFSVDIAEE